MGDFYEDVQFSVASGRTLDFRRTSIRYFEIRGSNVETQNAEIRVGEGADSFTINNFTPYHKYKLNDPVNLIRLVNNSSSIAFGGGLIASSFDYDSSEKITTAPPYTVIDQEELSTSAEELFGIEDGRSSLNHRISALIRNIDSSINVYIGASTITLTTSTGFLLKPGDAITVPGSYTIAAIAASGTPSVSYVAQYLNYDGFVVNRDYFVAN